MTADFAAERKLCTKWEFRLPVSYNSAGNVIYTVVPIYGLLV